MGRYAEQTVGEFTERLAAREPAPGGGAAAAISCALAAGLVQMACSFTADRSAHRSRIESLGERAAELRAAATWAADADARAYGRVIELSRRPGTGEELKKALSEAADVPLSVAELAAETADLASEIVARTSPQLRGDAVTGALLAEASACAAARLVQINLSEEISHGDAPGDSRQERAGALAVRAGQARFKALAFPPGAPPSGMESPLSREAISEPHTSTIGRA